MSDMSTRSFITTASERRANRLPTVGYLERAALGLCVSLALSPSPVRADLVSLAASGTIAVSDDTTIPVGTPWTFDVTYDTSAPDLDFELTGSPTPTFGRFTNTGATPALIAFHYHAGDYEVSIDDAADFGPGSAILITFDAVHAIDLNIDSPSLFPFLGGGPVFFHADFNDFSSREIFASDALPTDPELGPDSFDESTVSLLLPPTGVVSGNALASFTVPEPSSLSLSAIGALSLFAACRRKSRRGRYRGVRRRARGAGRLRRLPPRTQGAPPPPASTVTMPTVAPCSG